MKVRGDLPPSGAFTLENITALGDYTTVFVRSLLLAAIATVIGQFFSFLMALHLSHELTELGEEQRHSGGHRQGVGHRLR